MAEKKSGSDVPRISVNKLGEYIVSLPVRQNKILREQKYPAPFQGGVRYNEAEKAIARCIATGDRSHIINTVRLLQGKVATSDQERQRIVDSIDALNRFDAMRAKIDLSPFVTRLGPWKGFKWSLVFGGAVYLAPKAYVRHFKEVQLACRNIVSIWPTL